MKNNIIILFWVIFLLSCNGQPKLKEQAISIETPEPKSYYNVSIDSLHQMMEQLKNIDSFEFSNPINDPFLYLKTGYILTKEHKNAVLIQVPNDSTYSLKLYTLSDIQWTLNDSLSNFEGKLVQFYLELKDFNFDGIKDIYLQSSISNGYPLSRGNLLTVNSKTYKLKNHPETRDLGNLLPNSKTKTLVSERIIWCKKSGFKEVCTTHHKWKNDKLIFLSEKCPCEEEKEFD